MRRRQGTSYPCLDFSFASGCCWLAAARARRGKSNLLLVLSSDRRSRSVDAPKSHAAADGYAVGDRQYAGHFRDPLRSLGQRSPSACRMVGGRGQKIVIDWTTVRDERRQRIFPAPGIEARALSRIGLPSERAADDSPSANRNGEPESSRARRVFHAPSTCR